VRCLIVALLRESEAESGIYPSGGETQIIKYNDKINFYSHYILHLYYI